jgi:hypothetical protein
MLEPPAPPGYPPTPDGDSDEREHARRNALQTDVLRQALRRREHRAVVDQALRRMHEEEAS